MEADKGMGARFCRFTQSAWGLGGNPPRGQIGPERDGVPGSKPRVDLLAFGKAHQ
jgi:hypothetical protein